MWAISFALASTLYSCHDREAAKPSQVARQDSPPLGIRVSMDQLHAWEGVPPGWKFTHPAGDPAAGRTAFVELGCFKCHKVAGENFPATQESGEFVGPELTGMGEHHPPGYFAEAIVNPNAILVDGPGYLDERGASRMPNYPDMTVEQLVNLVAYLASLKGSSSHGAGPEGEAHEATAHHEHHGHHHGDAGRPSTDPDRLSYLVQAFEVEDERIDDFYRWFDARKFEDVPGLVRIDTYASRERNEGRHRLLVLLGFENDGALESFRKQKDSFPLGSFVRPVEQFLLEGPALYRAAQMSVP
ncbi:hypothetical protein HRbin30_02426 [bacterium HR30]|nr:hypothetical protein HRbin30_02426 [bacterium HR30]